MALGNRFACHTWCEGLKPGPTVGIAAAIHGNELNGIPVIQRLFREIDVKQLRGTLVGAFP